MAARHLAYPQPAVPSRQALGDTYAQIAVDTYLALPDADRSAIASAAAERLGPLWFGGIHQTDDAITRRAYAAELTTALIERGHLTGTMRHPRTPPAETPVEATLMQRHTMRQTQPRPRPALADPAPAGPDSRPQASSTQSHLRQDRPRLTAQPIGIHPL
jgi:hypothetical protein